MLDIALNLLVIVFPPGGLVVVVTHFGFFIIGHQVSEFHQGHHSLPEEVNVEPRRVRRRLTGKTPTS